MKILWISGRNIGKDLAQTTEINLCREFVKLGMEVTLISPGEINQDSFLHIRIRRLGFPGLETWSGSRNIKKVLAKELRKEDYDLTIVDWRYVFFLKKLLLESEGKWAMIDRSPPANSGKLIPVQKWMWKKSWGIASRDAEIGFVVSDLHHDYIRRKCNLEGLKIGIVPSGCQEIADKFLKSDPSILLKLVYSGRVDKNRGVMSIFPLSRRLAEKGIKHKISVFGDGDCLGEMKGMSEGNEFVDIVGRIDRKLVIEELEESHIGIMPMPDIAMWRISSPLKLAEYVASGLAVIGPAHPGNKLFENWEEGMLLTSGEDWTRGAVLKIGEFINSNWKSKSIRIRESSHKFSWEEIAVTMASYFD